MTRSPLDRALNIDDLRRLARRRVPGFALAYLESGAEDHATLDWNRQVFARWRFVPDTLVDASQRSLETRILGAPARMPLAVAPTGFNGMLCHRADVLLAQAARDAGIPFTLSTMSSASIEDIAREAPGGRFWFQLYMLRDREITRDLLRRAEAAGCEALVFTTDCVHFGNRESERRFFRAPMQLSLRSMLDTACHPGWVLDVIGRGRGVPGFGNLAGYFPAEDRKGRGAAFIVSRLDPAIRWDDLRFLRDQWRGKLVVKGILHARDARRAAELGADAVVLTNHGGRQLDGAISPMEALESVRAACPGLELLIDGGFRRGTDVAKALALGADAVLLGRALLYGAAAAGRAGIDKALAILASELDRTLGQLGVASVAELAPRHLRTGFPDAAPRPHPAGI
ncbi:alpha-hydroxy acid oxidase [Propionivibrio sp.]|uniref:alpha-hydroxy acid oxidase n=1 Tax=Propionivibrio sp. TaxID=2212460 RepID=UPI0039E2F3E7